MQALKAAGFAVSVDSVDPDELLRGGRAGADYLLSLNARHAVDRRRGRGDAGADPAHAAATKRRCARLVERMQRARPAFLADSILDPIPFGLPASLRALPPAARALSAQAPIMMGVGNLTELTEADTSGINALLFGIARRAAASPRC